MLAGFPVLGRRLSAFLCGALLLFPLALEAQLQTIVTDHFRIHFLPGSEGTARRAAEVGEEVFAPMATAFDYYEDFSPVHVLILDNSDVLGNGETDYYNNTILIWATNLDYELRGTHDWIKDVMTHELAHVMTLNRASKKWPFQFALFSVSRFDANPDITFELPLYHLSAPRWWSEGIAQFAPHQFGYDQWDTHRDMALRMATLEDDLLSYEEMGSIMSRPEKYYGEMVYNQGFGLLLYVEAKYGRDKVEALTRYVGTLSFDPAIRRVLGISADQLYADWVRYLKDNYGQVAAQIRNQGLFEGEALRPVDKGVIEYYPSLSPDGRKLAYLSSEKRDFPLARLCIFDLETGRKKVLDKYVDTRISWSPDSRQVLFVRTQEGFNDLYVYDLERDEEHRLSARLRAKDPSFSPDGGRIAFVRNEDGTNNLGLINRDGTGLAYLTNNNDGTQYSSPRWSPDGRWLLFSVFRGEDRDVALIRADSPPRPKNYGLRPRQPQVPDSLKVFPDSLAFPAPDTSGFRPLVASRADERDPCWLPDGSGFLFASDQGGVFNLYRYKMENGQVEQLTNVLGGAFCPTVSAAGKVVYAGYHANDYDLYQFDLGAYQRPARFDLVADRDYQSTFRGPKLSDEFSVQRYSGRRLFEYVPILQLGPTFIGNTFGLRQLSAGVQFSTGEQFGGEQLTTWGVLGKNIGKATNPNTDFGVFYERSLLPMAGNNRTFNPSLYLGFQHSRLYNLFETDTTMVVADTARSIVFPADPAVYGPDVTEVLVPNAEQRWTVTDRRRDLSEYTYRLFAVGVELPLTKRQQFNVEFLHRDYDETATLDLLQRQVEMRVIQDSVDITGSLHLPPAETRFDTTYFDEGNPLPFFRNLNYFTADDVTLLWRYRSLQPTADYALYPTGRSAVLLYRYMNPRVVDYMVQSAVDSDGVARDANGIVQDLYVPSTRRFRVDEYLFIYAEAIGLPSYNHLSISVMGGFKNQRLKKPSPSGQEFEGSFYWPLRYYLGGFNRLSGYPYFAAEGSKILYGRLGYSFPVSRRLSTRFFNFTFAKLYAELFAEAGAVGNSAKLDLRDLSKKDFLTDAGGELRMQLFSFYSIPMEAYFQVAHPFNRNRVERNPGDPPLDKWRYYFGLGF